MEVRKNVVNELNELAYKMTGVNPKATTDAGALNYIEQNYQGGGSSGGAKTHIFDFDELWQHIEPPHSIGPSVSYQLSEMVSDEWISQEKANAIISEFKSIDKNNPGTICIITDNSGGTIRMEYAKEYNYYEDEEYGDSHGFYIIKEMSADSVYVYEIDFNYYPDEDDVYVNISLLYKLAKSN